MQRCPAHFMLSRGNTFSRANPNRGRDLQLFKPNWNLRHLADGERVTSAGNLTNVFQGNGSASFDGLSVVRITMTADTLPSIAAPVTWTGTYTVQSNCAGTVTINGGGSVTLNLALYDSGADFLVTGNDATFTYSGTGNTQPASCSAATLSGVYIYSGTGYALSGSSISGALSSSGLLQFDGISNVTANGTLSGSGNSTQIGTVTGSYSLSSNCVGSATLTTGTNTLVVNFSITGATDLTASGFYLILAESGRILSSGTGHPVFGQPTAAAANQETADQPAAELLAQEPSATSASATTTRSGI
jgi:hypothetical protein